MPLHFSTRSLTAILCGLALGSVAHAADQGITGKKLLLKSNPKMVLLSKDALVAPGANGSGSDPRCAPDGGGLGGSVKLDDGTNSVTLNMPCANWATNGGGTLYKYKDTTGTPKVGIMKGGLLKVVSPGMGGFPVPNGAATVNVEVTVGTDKYCMAFTGTGDGSKFLVKDAAAAACPSPCPLAAGTYTMVQVSGGTLVHDGLPPFPFPSGTTIVQDVAAASPPGCVHDSVVPFPGGFSAPAYCIPGLGFTAKSVQTGCGVGRIDSNGGSDFTMTETGDTSSPSVCGLPGSCFVGDNSNLQLNVTVGDAIPDTCASGTANAAVSVSVLTTIWLPFFGGCPDPDGTYDPGLGDILIDSVPQILDFTTDSASAGWADLDSDGCALAGAGPSSPGLNTAGTCIDLTGLGVAGVDLVFAGAGAVGSVGGPLYDYTFTSGLPFEMTGPTAPSGAICATVPIVPYGGGTATRCIP